MNFSPVDIAIEILKMTKVMVIDLQYQHMEFIFVDECRISFIIENMFEHLNDNENGEKKKQLSLKI